VSLKLPSEDPTIPENDLKIEWTIRIWGRDEEIANMSGGTSYPQGIDPTFYPMAADRIPDLLQTLMMEPISLALRGRERLLIEEEHRQAEGRIKAETAQRHPAAPMNEANGLFRLSPSFQAPTKGQIPERKKRVPRPR
jgi:hypothetical protein